MTGREQFVTGFLAALALSLAVSAVLFFGSHADDAFDNAFWLILWIAAGTGVAGQSGTMRR